MLTQLDNTGELNQEQHPEWGYLVSRHAGSVNAAYVAMTRLKKLWPNLVFKLINTRDDDTVPWEAAIYAKRKEEEIAA